MKVCEICGDEIYTKDGENRCKECEKTERISRKKKTRRIRKDKILESFGLTKVRGALGGIYWE